MISELTLIKVVSLLQKADLHMGNNGNNALIDCNVLGFNFVGNKGEMISEFFLEITQFDFTKKSWLR